MWLLMLWLDLVFVMRRLLYRMMLDQLQVFVPCA